MLLRKMTAAFAPLVMCLAMLTIYRWLDGLMGAQMFFSLLAKGMLLGILLAASLPAVGLKCYHNGLTGWLYLGAGFFLLLLILHGLRFYGVIHLEIPLLLLDTNPMVTFTESAIMSFLALTAYLNRKRNLSKKPERPQAENKPSGE